MAQGQVVINQGLTQILNYALIVLIAALKGGAANTIMALQTGQPVTAYTIKDAQGDVYNIIIQKTA